MKHSSELIARLRDGQLTRAQALKALGAMGFAVGVIPLGLRSAIAADNATYFTCRGVMTMTGRLGPILQKWRPAKLCKVR